MEMRVLWGLGSERKVVPVDWEQEWGGREDAMAATLKQLLQSEH